MAMNFTSQFRKWSRLQSTNKQAVEIETVPVYIIGYRQTILNVKIYPYGSNIFKFTV